MSTAGEAVKRRISGILVSVFQRVVNVVDGTGCRVQLIYAFKWAWVTRLE